MNKELTERLTGALGSAKVVSGADVAPSAWQTRQPFRGYLMLYPSDTAEVAAAMALCGAARQVVVPIGGQTNLVRGCATRETDIGLSLARCNRIEEVDPVAQTMTLQAGVTLRDAQQAAADAGLFFPVDIGARDNCMLGGNVSTNAGGTKVIRHGMMRDSVLGLEAVLADGTVVSSMNRYIKNNSGFDLKHLFIGTEGTLGVVTRIVFRLSDLPRSHNVALLAFDEYASVVAALQTVRRRLGASLCGFEVMWNAFYAKAIAPEGRHDSPIDADKPYYAIVESMGSDSASDDALFEAVLAELMVESGVVDGVIAKSAAERDAIWGIRHEVEWLVRDAYNFDVSLRIADVGSYVDDVSQRITSQFANAYVAAFGHLGDNNVHVSVLVDAADAERDVADHIYQALAAYNGAISAEHGIGLEKRAYLPVSRSAEEIALMKALKETLDPEGILNPGKVIGS